MRKFSTIVLAIGVFVFAVLCSAALLVRMQGNQGIVATTQQPKSQPQQPQPQPQLQNEQKKVDIQQQVEQKPVDALPQRTVSETQVMKTLSEMGKINLQQPIEGGFVRWRLDSPGNGVTQGNEIKIFQLGDYLLFGSLHRAKDGSLVDSTLLTDQQIQQINNTGENQLPTFGATTQEEVATQPEAPQQAASQASAQEDQPATQEKKVGYMLEKPWEGAPHPIWEQMNKDLSWQATGDESTKSENSVFVFFDPRCPWCKRSYQAATTHWPKQNIKWVPVIILGDSESAWNMAASTLDKEKGAENLMRLMADRKVDYKINDELRKKIEDNTTLLYSLVNREGVSRFGVPALFWLDREKQDVTHLSGLSDKESLSKIFGQPGE